MRNKYEVLVFILILINYNYMITHAGKSRKTKKLIYTYIGSRVKGLRRPAKKKQKKPLDSPGSTQHK